MVRHIGMGFMTSQMSQCNQLGSLKHSPQCCRVEWGSSRERACGWVGGHSPPLATQFTLINDVNRTASSIALPPAWSRVIHICHASPRDVTQSSDLDLVVVVLQRCVPSCAAATVCTHVASVAASADGRASSVS